MPTLPLNCFSQNPKGTSGLMGGGRMQMQNQTKKREMMKRTPRQSERIVDLAWLAENMHILFPAAREKFEAVGRGCIVVDCTTVIKNGNRFGFVPQAKVPLDESELKRMLREYEPATQMVVHLLKTGDNTSTYRVGRAWR